MRAKKADQGLKVILIDNGQTLPDDYKIFKLILKATTQIVSNKDGQESSPRP